MSSEQGLRVTAVVTDSYGLSSSSGRKTSSDGEVTISAEYLFESCKKTEMKKNTITHQRALSTPAATANLWSSTRSSVNCIDTVTTLAHYLLMHYAAGLIPRVWKWRCRDVRCVQVS